jgi:hypothetical protein
LLEGPRRHYLSHMTASTAPTIRHVSVSSGCANALMRRTLRSCHHSETSTRNSFRAFTRPQIQWLSLSLHWTPEIGRYRDALLRLACEPARDDRPPIANKALEHDVSAPLKEKRPQIFPSTHLPRLDELSVADPQDTNGCTGDVAGCGGR